MQSAPRKYGYVPTLTKRIFGRSIVSVSTLLAYANIILCAKCMSLLFERVSLIVVEHFVCISFHITNLGPGGFGNGLHNVQINA